MPTSPASPPPAARVVIDLVGDAAHGRLAESRFVQRPFLPGGEHNMYELAFASAAAGWTVELRGWLDRPTFERFRDATGVAPSVELEARAPEREDLVVVPEGWRDPLDYARLLLSPARLAVFLLAAPGLFGWPFRSRPWSPPDPLTVELDAVATPAQFRAMDDLGISLLTHSPGIAGAAAAAGVSCGLVGTGRPFSPADIVGDQRRTIDVVGLLANRWAPFVTELAGQLGGLTVDLIEEVPNAEILRRFSQARVLLWPSRVEGHATIPWEARSVGCVPVALSSNRFAVGLSQEEGALVLDELDELAPAVRKLIADPDRWAILSHRARAHAADEVDWDRYVGRVRTYLDGVGEPGAAQDALAGMGAALLSRERESARTSQERLEELGAERARLWTDRDRLAERAAEIEAELERVLADRERALERTFELDAELKRVLADRERLAYELDTLQRNSAVRLALRMDAVRRRASRH